ncbi:GFA family protein [uncultured Alsobacter sp.]|uniref:GFA family protein n=1 Tax=uncultured Alsobacter sp. TaxID=1748258 RepID=UPI0025E4A3FE|nr:GFA family protein [uncultured Alsobacter sp.]
MSETTTGRCLCGGIRYSYRGAPKWTAYCHCESCRRATSSPVAVWIGVEREQFTWDTGTPAAYASSPGVIRRFCPTCGSPLSYEGDGWPTEVHILAPSLDDPSTVQPRGHVHSGEQLPWFEVDDDLLRFETVGGKDRTPLRRGSRRIHRPPSSVHET